MNPTDYTICHLCKNRVYMDDNNEFMILILSKNNKSNRIIFHSDCFFDAAGPEYKVALEYDKLSTPSIPIPKYTPANHDSGRLQSSKNLDYQLRSQQDNPFANNTSNTMPNHYNHISDHYKKAHDIIMQEMLEKQKADKP